MGDFASHIGQDAWVAGVFNSHSGGYFLDFGAFDGVTISNTLYLEQELGWRGICVEPNPRYFAEACRARSAILINAALYETSRETLSFIDAHGLSSFEHHASDDSWADRRREKGRRITVDTINPTELLDRFDSPRVIDYMSLDVEGAELDVLKAFDFNKYEVTLLTVEHNHVEPRRQDVRDHLSQFGYDVVGHLNDDLFFLKTFPFPNNPRDVLKNVAETYRHRA